MTSAANADHADRAEACPRDVHGFALDSRMWGRQVEAFGRRPRRHPRPARVRPQARDSVTSTRRRSCCAPSTLPGRARSLRRELVRRRGCGRLRAPVSGSRSLAHLAGPLLLDVGRASTRGHAASRSQRGRWATAAGVWLDDPLFEGLRNNEDLFEEVRQIVLDYGGAHWTGHVTTQLERPRPGPEAASSMCPRSSSRASSTFPASC